MKYAIPLILLVLTGCAGDAKTRALTSFAIACDSYASSLTVLAGLKSRGKLSDSQIAKVNRIRVVVTPVCKTQNPTNPEALLTSIEGSVMELVTLKEAANASR